MRDDRLGRAATTTSGNVSVRAHQPATIAAYVPRDALANEPGASMRI
jgi:hypothetical protein